MQQFQPLPFSLGAHAGHADDIRSRMVKTRNKSDVDWICIYGKHNRDFCGCGFGGKCSRSAKRAYSCHLPIDEVGGKLR
jgi:hypothetical protein